MTKLSERIKALIDNPEDLSILPELHQLAVESEKTEGDYQVRIDKLQATNRNLLKQIPIVDEPQAPQAEVAKTEFTVNDGVAAMKSLLEGE